jgi:ferredoxin-NADP reductase
MMQVVEGAPDPASQAGLKPALVAQNYFLPCRSRPAGDLVVRLPAEGASLAATLRARRALSPSVAAVWIAVPGDVSGFRPGQYVNLVRDDGLVRSYSIANLPEQDGALELHIRREPYGQMSNWLHDAPLGTALRVRGPAGECFYMADSEQADFPMLLAGTGTGLAPLLGVVRDALAHGHRGPVWLMHGARAPAALYYADPLRALAAAHPNLTVRFSVTDSAACGGDITDTPVQACVAERLKETGAATTRVFLCGAPDLVKDLKKQCFLAGVPSRQIHSDPFLMAEPPAQAA